MKKSGIKPALTLETKLYYLYALLTRYPCCPEKTLEHVLQELLHIYHSYIRPMEELYHYKDLNRHTVTGEICRTSSQVRCQSYVITDEISVTSLQMRSQSYDIITGDVLVICIHIKWQCSLLFHAVHEIAIAGCNCRINIHNVQIAIPK